MSTRSRVGTSIDAAMRVRVQGFEMMGSDYESKFLPRYNSACGQSATEDCPRYLTTGSARTGKYSTEETKYFVKDPEYCRVIKISAHGEGKKTMRAPCDQVRCRRDDSGQSRTGRKVTFSPTRY